MLTKPQPDYKNCGFLKKFAVSEKKKIKNACSIVNKHYLCNVFEAKNCFNI